MNLALRADGDPKNGQKVSLLAPVANSETHRKIRFPKTPVWGSYFTLFHCQHCDSYSCGSIEVWQTVSPDPPRPLPCSLRRWTALIHEQLPPVTKTCM